jgi:hypothetical protein
MHGRVTRAKGEPAARRLLTLPPRRDSVVTQMFRLLGPVAVVLALWALPASAQPRQTTECGAGDQRACLVLARSASATIDVRLAAVRKLTDQALLTDLATTSPVRDIRLAAIRGLIDQDALADLARHAKGAVERGAAVERLTNQEVLANIARTDPSKWVRRRAANCLTDEHQIAKLIAEGRKELLPTLTAGGGIRHVTVDGKDVRETLLGITTLMPGRHLLTADFSVTENVTWDESSTRSVVLDARLGASYILEAEVGIVTWTYLSPQTRHGRGSWKLVVREEVSSGPDLLPAFLRH